MVRRASSGTHEEFLKVTETRSPEEDTEEARGTHMRES